MVLTWKFEANESRAWITKWIYFEAELDSIGFVLRENISQLDTIMNVASRIDPLCLLDFDLHQETEIAGYTSRFTPLSGSMQISL